MKPETKRTDLDLHLIIMVFLIILNLCCRKVQGSKSTLQAVKECSKEPLSDSSEENVSNYVLGIVVRSHSGIFIRPFSLQSELLRRKIKMTHGYTNRKYPPFID